MAWTFTNAAIEKDFQGTITVRFVSASGENLHVTDTRPRQVWIHYRCLNREREAVRRFEQTTLDVHVSIPKDGDRMTIRVAEALRPHFNRSGITLIGAQYASGSDESEISAIALTQIELPITIDPGDRIAREVRISPRTATLTVPKDHAAIAGDRPIEVRLSDAPSLTELPAGVSLKMVLPLHHPALRSLPGAKVEPERAEAELILRSQETLLRLNRVPIVVALPPGLAGRYGIRVGEDAEQRVLAYPVELIGPQETIERIQNGDLAVQASIDLTPVELERGIDSKCPVLKLPQGVRLHEPTPLQPIKLTITPK